MTAKRARPQGVVVMRVGRAPGYGRFWTLSGPYLGNLINILNLEVHTAVGRERSQFIDGKSVNGGYPV